MDEIKNVLISRTQGEYGIASSQSWLVAMS